MTAFASLLKSSLANNVKKNISKTATKALALSAISATALFATPTVQAQDIDYINASFSVGYNSQTGSGNSRLTVKRQASQQYAATFEAEHPLLDITQKANFSMKQCNVQPISYSTNANPALKSRVKESIDFNWSQKKASYSNNKDEHNSFTLNKSLLDPFSFFFKARCDLMAGKKNLSYPIIYKGKERTHKYKVIGSEKVKTGIGEVEALVVERVRGNKSRQTRFYVAPSLDYMLVKIEHRESALTKASATLTAMDYKVSK